MQFQFKARFKSTHHVTNTAHRKYFFKKKHQNYRRPQIKTKYTETTSISRKRIEGKPIYSQDVWQHSLTKINFEP